MEETEVLKIAVTLKFRHFIVSLLHLDIKPSNNKRNEIGVSLNHTCVIFEYSHEDYRKEKVRV